MKNEYGAIDPIEFASEMMKLETGDDIVGIIVARDRAIRLQVLKSLASALRKVCPEVIPQILSTAHPEDEFIAFLQAGESQ
jgi:hypothetical protein